MDEAEEKQAALAKRKGKKPARKETASSVLKETLPGQGSTPLDGVAEVPHRPDTAPAEIGSLPGDKSPAPQPEGVRRKNLRRRRQWRARPEHRGAAESDQPPDPPSDNVDPATEQGNAEAASSKISGDPSSPKKEVIDLTIKEESPPATPIPPPHAPESNEGPVGLKAGWVRFPVISTLDAL